MKRFSGWWFWLVVALIFLSPAFFYPGFGLVDDGQIGRIFHDFRGFDISAIANWLRDTHNGRFRPFYVLGILLYPLASRHQVWVWVLVNTFLLAGTLRLAEKILRRLLNPWLIRLTLLSVLLWPSWAANWYRFGTAEPRQLLLILLTWFWLAEGKRHGWWLAWLTALWSKETTILLAPATLGWGWVVLPANRRRIVMMGVCFLLAVGTWWLMPMSSGYTQNIVSWREALHVLMVHAPIAWPETYYGFILAAALWAMVLGDAWRRKQGQGLAEKLSFGAAAISFLLPVLMWQPPLERYLFPANFFLTLTLVLGGQEWWQRFRRRPAYWYLSVGFLLLVAIPPQQWWRAGPALAYRSGQEIYSWVQNYTNHGALTNWLLTNRPQRVYIDSTDQEYCYAIGLYATNFAPNMTGVTIVSPFTFPLPIYRFSAEPVEAFRFECNAGDGDCFLLTTSMQVAQQFTRVTPLGLTQAWFIIEPEEN